MNVSLQEINNRLEKAGMSPVEIARIDAISSVYVQILAMFTESLVYKFLETEKCRSIGDYDVALEKLKNSNEIKQQLFGDVLSKLMSFIDVEKVCGNVGHATSINEVRAFTKRFKSKRHQIRRRVQVWVNRELHRVQ